MKNKNTIAILDANKKGYRVINGKVFYNEREVSVSIKKSGYYYFSIRMESGDRRNIMVHRLVAYQKFGNKMFNKHIQVRHFDGNCTNNLDENILLGTSKENNMDKLPSVRLRAAINASNHAKKHNHEKIIELHNKGLSYKKIMDELNIKSKGTISFIIKKSMESKK